MGERKGKEKRRMEECLFPKREEQEEGEGKEERVGEVGEEGGREPSVSRSIQSGGGVSGLPEDEKVKMPGNVPAKDRGHTLIRNSCNTSQTSLEPVGF